MASGGVLIAWYVHNRWGPNSTKTTFLSSEVPAPSCSEMPWIAPRVSPSLFEPCLSSWDGEPRLKFYKKSVAGLQWPLKLSVYEVLRTKKPWKTPHLLTNHCELNACTSFVYRTWVPPSDLFRVGKKGGPSLMDSPTGRIQQPLGMAQDEILTWTMDFSNT